MVLISFYNMTIRATIQKRQVLMNFIQLELAPEPTVQAVIGIGSIARRLTVKLSLDDGQTWPVAKVLEEGPSAYSALAVLADGTILCLYECDILTRMGDDRYLRLARFDMEWLTAD